MSIPPIPKSSIRRFLERVKSAAARIAVHSRKPIDPYWWCRDDEWLAKMSWERIEKPYLLEQFAKFDDPKFWEVPEKTESKP